MVNLRLQGLSIVLFMNICRYMYVYSNCTFAERRAVSCGLISKHLVIKLNFQVLPCETDLVLIYRTAEKCRWFRKRLYTFPLPHGAVRIPRVKPDDL